MPAINITNPTVVQWNNYGTAGVGATSLIPTIKNKGCTFVFAS